MNTSISLALLNAAAYASSLGPSGGKEFLAFVATNNKDYGTTQELESRIRTYNENSATVEKLNRDNVGVSFEANYTSDLTEKEFKERLGVDSS